MLIDEGSQLVKGCQTMQSCFKDIKEKLHKDMMLEFGKCPVGGHNFNGKFECKIYKIKESLEKTLLNQRLSVLQ